MPTNSSPASPSVSPIEEVGAARRREIAFQLSGLPRFNARAYREGKQCMWQHPGGVYVRWVDVVNFIESWNRRASASLAQRSDDRRAGVPSGDELLERIRKYRDAHHIVLTTGSGAADIAEERDKHWAWLESFARSVPLSGASDTTSEERDVGISEQEAMHFVTPPLPESPMRWSELLPEHKRGIALQNAEQLHDLAMRISSGPAAWLDAETDAHLVEEIEAMLRLFARDYHLRAASSETTSEEAKQLRRLLFLSHPCSGKYGDDGELQCASCRIDFKRDSVEHIDLKLIARGMKLMDALRSSPSPSILQKDTTDHE